MRAWASQKGEPDFGERPQKWNSVAAGSPIGQRHMRSLMVSTVAWLPSARVTGSSSTTGAAGTWARTVGVLCATGSRGRAEREGLARPARPSRGTLPITALRVTPPRARAIWLAERPSVHNVLSCSTRSSDQFICVMALAPAYPGPSLSPPVTRYSSATLTPYKHYGYHPSPCPHEFREVWSSSWQRWRAGK